MDGGEQPLVGEVALLREPPAQLRDRIAHVAASNARSTRSGVNGICVSRAPHASKIALAIAGIGALAVISPIPLAPYGPFGAGRSMITLSISGESAGPGIRYSLKSVGPCA